MIKTSFVSFLLFVLTALMGSLFLAVISQISFSIPSTPIPITLQTVGVFILAGILGRKAFFSVLLYLVEGSLGLPVFAGGKSQSTWLTELGAGYLIGFLVVAYIVGKCLESKKYRSLPWIFFILSIGHVILFVNGWIGMLYFLGAKEAYLKAIAPFYIPAISKIILSTFILKGLFTLKTIKKKDELHAKKCST